MILIREAHWQDGLDEESELGAFARWWSPRSSVGQPLLNDSKFTTEARTHGENPGVPRFFGLVRSVCQGSPSSDKWCSCSSIRKRQASPQHPHFSAVLRVPVPPW